VFPDVPIFIDRQKGAGLAVWPSFYDNQLGDNRREIRRKRIEITHSGKQHVALYVKKVRAEPFGECVRSLLDEGIQLAPPGRTWQSVRVEVPFVDPKRPLEEQIDQVSSVFTAARRLFDFYLNNEERILAIPTFK
jgi:hypothetical protein